MTWMIIVNMVSNYIANDTSTQAIMHKRRKSSTAIFVKLWDEFNKRGTNCLQKHENRPSRPLGFKPKPKKVE